LPRVGFQVHRVRRPARSRSAGSSLNVVGDDPDAEFLFAPFER